MAGGLVAGPRMRPVHASLVVEGIMERRPDPEWWPLPPLVRRPDLRVDKAARTCYFRSADWPWWRSIYVHTYEHTCLHAYMPTYVRICTEDGVLGQAPRLFTSDLPMETPTRGILWHVSIYMICGSTGGYYSVQIEEEMVY